MGSQAKTTGKFSALTTQNLRNIIEALIAREKALVTREIGTALEPEAADDFIELHHDDFAAVRADQKGDKIEEFLEINVDSTEKIGRSLLIATEDTPSEGYFWVFADANHQDETEFRLFKFVAEIRNSAQPREFVTDCYKILLERLPDHDGLIDYIEKIRTKELSSIDLIRLMIESEEGAKFTEKILIIKAPNILFQNILPSPRLLVKLDYRS